MKMRKYFVMALVALGATAAFSSCQKDPKAYDAPKVEFRDANNAVIKEFNQASFGAKKEITVVVTLGDSKEVTLKKLEVSVVTDNSTIKKPYTVSTIKGNAGDVKDKQVGTVKLADLQIAEGDYAKSGLKIVAVATDSRAKVTTVECVYKAKGGETPTGTPMKNENTAAYVNHAFGEGTGAYSFSGKKAVTALDAGGTEREIINLSETGKPFVLKFGSEAEFKFVKLNSGDVDYATATAEKVGALNKGATAEIELKEGDMFIAVAKDGLTFYLAKVTKVSTDGYYDGAEKAAAPTAKGKGYILFSYKSNK